VTKEMELAKRIYETWTSFEGTDKQKAVAVARELLGKSEDGKRDLIFEALCTAMGADWKQMPRHEAAKYNEATKQLREIGATPEDVLHKARRYEHLHPDWPLTPTSLISHWSSLDVSASRRVPVLVEQLRAREQEPEEELVPPTPEFLAVLRAGPLTREMP